MSDQPEQAASKRGEAAWKEAKERVAERNAQTQKAGKQERAAYELGRDQSRRDAEGRRRARLLSERQAKS